MVILKPTPSRAAAKSARHSTQARLLDGMGPPRSKCLVKTDEHRPLETNCMHTATIKELKEFLPRWNLRAETMTLNPHTLGSPLGCTVRARSALGTFKIGTNYQKAQLLLEMPVKTSV